MRKISLYQIAAKNLLRKRTRSALTVVGIGLSAWVLASLLGFNRGYDAALKKDIDNMGFQVLLTAKGCPYEAATLMLKGGTGLRYMSESVMADILAPARGRKRDADADAGRLRSRPRRKRRHRRLPRRRPGDLPADESVPEVQAGRLVPDPEARVAVLGYEAAELEQREVGDKLLIPDKNIELRSWASWSARAPRTTARSSCPSARCRRNSASRAS